jgi:hypothetical protein
MSYRAHRWLRKPFASSLEKYLKTGRHITLNNTNLSFMTSWRKKIVREYLCPM